MKGGKNKKRFTKEHRDICGYAYVHYSDFGDSFMGVYTCQLTKD